MKEHPIIFSTEMIPKILDGAKTQTRRVCKQANEWAKTYDHSWVYFDKKRNEWQFKGRSTFSGLIETFILTCPYGQAGDRLWVRETFIKNDIGQLEYYVADQLILPEFVKPFLKKVPSIFMPRWASRILLEITGLRAKRLQEISPEDCILEGLQKADYLKDIWKVTALSDFRALWDSLNAKRGYGWDTNCWVWVISFKLLNS